MFAKIVDYSARRPGHHDRDLNLDWLQLTEVVYGALPEDLKELSLCRNPLLEIDCALLPKTLEVLDLKHCRSLERILNLDQLPNLASLTVCDTAISTLPRLPASLQHLSVSHCTKLTSLPPLARTNLQTLTMRWTINLQKLPELPEGFASLHAQHSGLAELPMLPESLMSLLLDRSVIEKEGLVPERPDTVRYGEYAATTRAWWNACLRLERYEALHESLMMAAWHPDRVGKWLSHGESTLDMMMGTD